MKLPTKFDLNLAQTSQTLDVDFFVPVTWELLLNPNTWRCPIAR